jgi:hypothetical protein
MQRCFDLQAISKLKALPYFVVSAWRFHMIWELGVDAENQEEAQATGSRPTPHELSRTQLLDVRERALQLQCHPNTRANIRGIAEAFLAFLHPETTTLADYRKRSKLGKGYDT